MDNKYRGFSSEIVMPVTSCLSQEEITFILEDTKSDNDKDEYIDIPIIGEPKPKNIQPIAFNL